MLLAYIPRTSYASRELAYLVGYGDGGRSEPLIDAN